MDQRTFGLVTDYHMADSVPWLHVHHVDGPCKIALQQLLTVIKSDWINYALQTAGGTNGTVLNAVELLAIMNDTLTLCTKSWELPAKVKNSLSIPYGPAAMVSVIRPDTLVKVSVPRPHIIDCALKKKAKRVVYIRAVQLQNRLLIDADQNDIALLEAAEDVSRRSATTFRPTALERQINDAIAHPDNKYRGLSVTHFAQFTLNMILDEATPVANMTDFSRKNSLQPASTSPTCAELIDSLRNLRQFGRSFYNSSTGSIPDAALVFAEAFGEGGNPDNETTCRLLLWLNMKLGKFRGLVLSTGLQAALEVKNNFSLHDSLLSKLLYDHQQAKIASLQAKLDA
ncbi:hypothetical protein JG687_00009158 [Phytophthora cactorum]|uniref:Uncharacterized protein n=1 Tax=Phytophthora cactorum TaxID=29920 RepID=A0A8T1UAR4_9STRA|nr:hypothetical protein JG687_00009158 [Phytophthora cactorum]